MSKVIRVFRYANTLSLDVTVGAMVGASFFSAILKVKLNWSELVCLGLIVWIIYTVGHLLDADQIKSLASTHRHRFHQKYFVPIAFTACFALLASIVCLFFIRKPLIFWGIGLMAMVIIYFLYEHRLGILKELFGAFLYIGGILLPSISSMSLVVSWLAILLIVSFFITVWINLILFSWFSYEQDRIDNQSSIAVYFGDLVTRVILYGLFAIQFSLLLYCTINYPGAVLIILVLFLMNIELFTLLFNTRWLAKNDKYRMLGDTVFLLPLFYLFTQ